MTCQQQTQSGNALYAILLLIRTALFPEPWGYIREVIAWRTFVKPLVRSALFQASEMLDIWSELYIIKVCLAHCGRYTTATAIPRHLQPRMLTVQIAGKCVHIRRFCVSTHKTDTGYIASILLYKPLQNHWRQRLTDILPQVLAVTTRTPARTVRQVYRECDLVGNLLKYHSRIHKVKHTPIWLTIEYWLPFI